MGLFDQLFKRKKEELPAATTPDISEELFIEKGQNGQNNGQAANTLRGIDAVHSFLQDDFESKGYSDAITNPDDTYMKKNLDIIRHKLEICIQSAEKFYRESLAIVELHIQMHSRSGLVDLVQELNMKKAVISDHMGVLQAIREGLEKNEGISQTPFLSYNTGFLRGITAVTHAKAINTQL